MLDKTAVYVLHTGDLAYFDTFSGLLPIKVLRVYDAPTDRPAGSETRVEWRVTATRGAYVRGEVCDTAETWVVHRGTVHRQHSRHSLPVIIGRTVCIPD